MSSEDILTYETQINEINNALKDLDPYSDDYISMMTLRDELKNLVAVKHCSHCIC